MLVMLVVLKKLMLVLGILIVDNWVASPDQTGVVICFHAPKNSLSVFF